MKKLLSSVLALSLFALVSEGTLLQEKDAKPLEIGKPVPSLRLNDHTGRAVAVGGKSDGWTALAFFPKAFTPG